MEIKTKMQNAVNKQINAELYSAYLYLSMSAYCESINLKGFARWMREQAKEETGHAMKLYGYVHERGGKVTLSSIGVPTTTWKSPTAVFEHTYNHEKKVTEMIDNLVNLAMNEKDYATTIFLQWFVTEQVEEEASASEIWETLKMIGASKNGLIMLDKQLGKRGAR